MESSGHIHTSDRAKVCSYTDARAFQEIQCKEKREQNGPGGSIPSGNDE